MTILLLGPLTVTDNDTVFPLARRAERVVLAALAIRPGQVVPTGSLVEAVWGDEAPANAASLLRPPMSRLRTTLRQAGDSAPVGADGGYRLDLAAGECDVAVAESARAEASRLSDRGRHEQAAEVLREAGDLWRGRPLGELADEPFARLEAERLAELRNLVVEDRVEAELAIGRHAHLAMELPALVDAEPFREVRWAQWMRALYRCGRQAEALHVYARLRAFLGEELGIEPVPWIRALEEAMLRQSADLAWQPAGADVHRPRVRACAARRGQRGNHPATSMRMITP